MKDILRLIRPKQWLKNVFVLLPVFFLLYMLFFSGTTVIYSAVLTILVTIGVSFIRKETRMSLKDLLDALADGAKKAGTVTYDINLKTADGAKTANVYLPYPMSDQNQDISNVRVSGNYDNQAVYHDPKTGSNYLMATWGSISGTPKLTFSFHVDSHYKKGGTLKDSGAKMPVDVLPYLAANDYLPSDNPKVKALAEKAVKGKKGTLARARAVYDWTIANTHRDNSVKGCGLGQAIRTLTEANGGGKCADISSVFITVARAAGIPARDVFGLRTKGKDGAITGDFHCWAEFYLPGTGWVQVDPADVRKAMLNEKLELGDQATKKYTEFFWNGDDLFRIALNRQIAFI